MKNLVFGITLSVFILSAFANTQPGYVGQETRDIKALSQQEVEAYQNGKGLGYAKAAELNQYPGPRHVLEMSEELSLTKEQTQQTRLIFDAMKEQAITLGTQLVEKERELDQQFVSGSIDALTLQKRLSDIGLIETQIRFVHLNAHIEQKNLLSKHQIHTYDQMRGYGESGSSENHHSHE